MDLGQCVSGSSQNCTSHSQRRLGFGATRKLGDAARALLTSSRRQTAPQACVSMNMLFPLSRKAIRATGDLILHTAQHLRVVTISNVGGTPPPGGLPKLKNKIWNFNMLRGSLALPRDGAEVSDSNGLKTKEKFGRRLPYCSPKRFRTAAQTCPIGDESRASPPLLQTHGRRHTTADLALS